MSAKPDVWMPFYIGDYLADTLHLTPEQHGAYVLLLFAAWMRGGSLPNDEAQLARIARCDKATWKRVRANVLEYFEADADNLVQKRLALEYANAVRANNAQRMNGAKGGRPPKPKPNPIETQEEPMGSVRANPNETPSQLQELQEQEQKKALRAIDPPDPKKAAFDAALTILGSRSLVAKHMGSAGHDVLRWAVGQTLEANPDDPKTYLLKLLQPKPERAGKADAYGFVLDAYGRRTGERGVVC